MLTLIVPVVFKRGTGQAIIDLFMNAASLHTQEVEGQSSHGAIVGSDKLYA